RQHLETTERDLQLFFNRLIRVCYATHYERLRVPVLRFQFGAQQLGRIRFHHDFAFKIEAGRKTEVFVCRPGVTVNATMLASAIGIETCLKTDIGADVTSDDRLGSVTKILCSAAGPLVSVRVDVDNIEVININVQSFEPIGRTPGSPPPTD